MKKTWYPTLQRMQTPEFAKQSILVNTIGLSIDIKETCTLESIFHTISKCVEKATMDTYTEMRSSETFILFLA